MEAHAWKPPPLTPAQAQETIRRIHKTIERLQDIHFELADIRHMLAYRDQGDADDPCDMAAREVALCLPELKAAGRLLEELA